MKKNVFESLDNFSDEMEEKDTRYRENDMIHIFACMSLVILELEMREKEVKILDELYG